MLDNLESGSKKATDALKALGVSLYQTGANGQQQMRPIWNVLMDISNALQTANSSQTKLFSDLAGGKYQFDSFVATIRSAQTLTDAYNTSLNSAGETQKLAADSMHTLQAELQRLQDSIQQLAYNAGTGGLGNVLKSMVVGITDLINGLQKIPPAVDYVGAGFVALMMSGKMLTSMSSTLKDMFDGVGTSVKFLSNPISALTAAWSDMSVKVRTVTADLALKTEATTADVAASEAEGVASATMVAALDAETVAADAATASFTALDVVTGGIALVIAAAVVGVGAWAVSMGKATTATNGTTQSVDQLNTAIQNAQQTADASTQKTADTITQLQNLKSQYEQVTQAMATAQQGSAAYKQAQSDLINIQQQLIGLVGNDAAQTILSAKDKIGAWNGEIQAMVDLQINELTVQNDRLKQEQDFTSGFIAETNKRIDAIMSEAQAQAVAANAAANPYSGGNLETASAINPNYHAPVDLSGGMADAQHQLLLGAKQEANAAQYGNSSGGPLADKLAQWEALKKALEINPDTIPSQTVSGATSAPTGTTSATKSTKVPSASSVASAYAAPFQNLSTDDTNALQAYLDKVNNTSASMQALNTQLSDADNALKSNVGSTSSLNQVISTYDQYIAAARVNQAALTAENDKAHQLLGTINTDIKQVNAQYKAGTISAQAHKDALSTLDSEWSNLTNTIKSNTAAITVDNKSMATATQTITSEITATLKQAYTDQQQIEDQRLANIYQPEIDALTAQKNAVDQLIQSLNDQYAIQDAQQKLATDQQNLNTEMTQNQSYRIVNADGSISWTYDTTKVQSMQQQVLKDQRDVQKAELQQQSNNLANQLKAVQDTYNQQKTALDDYWKYKLSTDNLNTEADNAISKDGLIGALQDVTTYTSQIIAQWNAVQQAKVLALGSSTLAGSLGGAGFSASGSYSAQLNSYWQNVKNAGGAYANPTGNGMTLAQQKAHEAALYGIPVSDVQTTANGQTFVPWQYVQNHAIAASAPSWNSPAAGMTTAGSSVSTNNSKVVNLNVANVNVNQQSDMNYLIDQINSALG